MISGAALKAGVMGWPVEHSLSPRLHGYWLGAYGINGVYMPLAVKPENLAEAFRALPEQGYKGWNVTVPHKEEALSLVDEADEAARSIGAVNTVVVREDGRILGSNTDAYGFMRNLKAKLPDMAPYREKALVLGAGGAARAVCYALQQEGVKEIFISNRNRERADALARHFGAPCKALPWNDIPGALAQVTLLVNATSLGMKDQPPLDVDLAPLPARALAADIVYQPLRTEFLACAQARGCVTVNGLGMLIYQAVPGFAAWFGVTPEVTTALETYLAS